MWHGKSFIKPHGSEMAAITTVTTTHQTNLTLFMLCNSKHLTSFTSRQSRVHRAVEYQHKWTDGMLIKNLRYQTDTILKWSLFRDAFQNPCAKHAKVFKQQKILFSGKNLENCYPSMKEDKCCHVQRSNALGPLGCSSGYQKLGPGVQTHIKMECSHLHVQS